MTAAAPAPETIEDPIVGLAVLLRRWRLRPRRSARWLDEFLQAFEKREPAAHARYLRVSALGVEMARLLALSPASQAAIRGSALLSSVTVAATNPALDSSKRTARPRGWEKELRGWRWLQVSAGVVQGLQPSLDASHTTAQHSGPSIESRVLAVAEDFEEMTAGRGGVLRALHALRAGSPRHHDRRLVELLWSEAGQATCDRVLRRRGKHHERAVRELEESTRLLERVSSGPALQARRHATARLLERTAEPAEPLAAQGHEAGPKEVEEPKEEGERPPESVKSGPPAQVPRQTTARLEEETAVPSEPASPSEAEARPKEVEEPKEEGEHPPESVKSGPAPQARRQAAARLEQKVTAPADPAAARESTAQPNRVEQRREDMSKTAANEEQNTKTRRGDDGDSTSLNERVGAAARELEEIRAAATRGLEALASVGPAMEELSALVSRLQASLLPVQGSENLTQPRPQPNDLRSIALRVERSEGDLDSAEVMDALDTLRDLRDIRVREQGSSWTVLRARTDPDIDLAILQAKVAGSLTRRLRGADNGEGLEVTILEGS